MKKYISVLYTAVISVAIFSILLSVRGFYPFGNGSVMLTDMYDECVPSLYRFYDIIKGYKNIFYEFQASGGLNLYTETINEIVNPFNYILLFWKRENIYLAVNILLILYVVFAACSAHFFLIKIWPASSKLNCLLSICYAFSGYFVYNFQILRWMIIPVIFPIFLLSCIRLWSQQKGTLYSVLLAYQIVLSVQHGYMTLLFCLFASGIWVYCVGNKKTRKKFCLNVAAYTLVGIFLSAIVLLPTLSTLVNSARSGANASYFKLFVEHGFKDLFERIFQFCHPVLVGLLLYCIYMIKKKQKFNELLKDDRTRFWIVLNVFLSMTALIQPINLLWHMGSYVCFPVRYGYMLVLSSVCLVKILYENCEFDETNEKKICTVGVIKVLAIICLLLGSVILVRKFEADIVKGFLSLTISSTHTKEAIIVSIILLMLFVATIVACIKKEIFKGLLFVIIVVSSFCYFHMVSLPDDFREIQEVTYRAMTKEYQIPQADDFNRVIKRQKQNLNYPRNAALINGVSSMSGYFPTAEAVFQKSMDKLGYMTPWVSTIDVGGTKISDYYFNHVFFIKNSNKDFQLEKNMPLENQKVLLNALFADELTIEERESIFSIVQGESYFDVKNKTTLYLDAGMLCQNLIIKVNDSDISIPFKNMQDSPHVLICLGTFDAGTIEVKLQTEDGTACSLENVKVGLLDEYRWNIASEDSKNKLNANRINIESKGLCCKLELFDSTEKGILVLPINATEGWKVWIDGKKTDIIKIGECFIGVAVEKGQHNIEFNFYPPYFGIGCIAGAIGIIILLILHKHKNRKEIVLGIKIETIMEQLYLYVFWGAVLVLYIIPTLGITIHMCGRVIKLFI